MGRDCCHIGLLLAQVTASWSFRQNTEHMNNGFAAKFALYLDLIINVGVAVLIPAFNVFFLLKSETLIDAVLNSTAIFFVVELDDIMNADWDIATYMEYLACSSHD